MGLIPKGEGSGGSDYSHTVELCARYPWPISSWTVHIDVTVAEMAIGPDLILLNT